MATAQEKQLAIAQQQFKGIRRYITDREGSLAKLLPSHIPVEQLIHTAFSCISKNPTLLECTPESWQRSLIDAAQLGLLPSSANQYGHLIPYKEKGVMTCHFQTGYRGRIKLARDSGQVNNIYAHVVHQRDEFELVYGSEESISHKPCFDGNPGPFELVYAVAELTNGSKLIEYMMKDRVDWIRDNAKASSGPWYDSEFSYEEMARKSVINAIYKYLPSSPQMDKAVAVDNEGHSFTEEDTIPVDFSHIMAGADTPVQSQAEETKEQLKAKQDKKKVTPAPPTVEFLNPARVQIVTDAAGALGISMPHLQTYLHNEWRVDMSSIPDARFDELMEHMQTGAIQEWVSLGQSAEGTSNR